VAKHEVRRVTPSVGPAASFLFGMAGCLSAVFIPKIGAFLQASAQSLPAGTEQVKVLSLDYGLPALLFSGLVGVAVMAYYWGKARTPWETFVTAYGLPAALAAALAGGTSVKDLTVLQQEKQALEQQLAKAAGVKIHSALRDRTTGTLAAMGLPFTATLHAETVEPGPEQMGIQLVEPDYWIVFHSDTDRPRTDARLAELKSRVAAIGPVSPPLNLEVVRHGERFLVVESGGGRKRAAALSRAIDLKNRYQVPVDLQEVPRR
jgi:hypothetical protein